MRNRLLSAAAAALALASVVTLWSGAQHVAEPTCFSYVCEAVYDTLLDVDPEGDIVPGLATWEFSPGGQEIVLHLREGVLFQNGEVLRSEVVLLNFEIPTHLFLDFRREPLLGSGLIEDAYAIDEYTLAIRPGALCAFQVLSRLAGPAGMMVSVEALERFQFDYAYEPIGTGAYRLVLLEPDRYAVLEALPEHWHVGPRPPVVELRVIPDEDDRVEQLKQGNVQVISGSAESHFNDLACATAFDVYGRPTQYQAVTDKIDVWPFYGDGLMHFDGAVFDEVLAVAVDGFLVCRLEQPRIVLTNAAGLETTRFALLDSVYAAFTRLLPDTDYEVRLVRSDGRIEHALVGKSDTVGIIPSTALLWDIGVEYDGERSGRFRPEISEIYTYTCDILRGGNLLASAEFSVVPLEDSRPILFASDEAGNPLNGFGCRDDVYVTGVNFPRGTTVEVHLVQAQYSWEHAERLEPTTGTPITIQVPFDRREFTVLVWRGANTLPGAYDIVGEWVARDGFFSRMDAIDGEYGVGFTILGAGGGTHHVEAETACQQPPLKPDGTVSGAPNPQYKNYFGIGESIWIAVNPYTGGGNYSNKTARLYVVDDQNSWSDNATLVDKSGGYVTAVIQPGCANVNYHRVWPKASGGDYDVIVDFSPYGVYNKGQDIIDHVAVQGFVVPDPAISLKEIEFNYNASSVGADGVNIRPDKTSKPISPPEWEVGKPTKGVAYTAGHSVQIRATFTAASWVQSAQIKAVTTSGGLSGISYQTVTFTNGSATVLMNVTTPSAVDVFIQTWEWMFKNVDGTGSPEEHFATSSNKVYVILAQPTLPWTATGTTQVWTQVLNWSCAWAKGQATQRGAAAAVAQRLWNGAYTGGKYDYSQSYTDDGKGANFKLTNFLAQMGALGDVNCYDMSKSSVAFGSALGCDLNHFYTWPWGYMNCIMATGKGWNCSESFDNHAFSMMSGRVYDACMAVDTDGTPTAAPPATFTWLTDITWSTYQSYVMKGSTPGTPTKHPFTVE